MLKILGVAATLRCDSKDQEERTVQRHNILIKIFIPGYLITQGVVYGCQLWIFSDLTYTLPLMITFIVGGNLFKLCFTFSLGVIIWIFGY